jgi:membrane protein required for beta-lactamase induction
LEHEVGSLTMAQADHYLVRSIHDGSRRLDVLGVSFHDSTVAVGGLALILGLLILLFSNLAALRRAAARAGHGAAWAGPAFEPTRLAQLLSVGLHVALPVTAVVALILWSWPQLPVALRFLSLLLSVAVLAVGIGCEGVAHGFRRLFTDPPASRGTAHNGLP